MKVKMKELKLGDRIRFWDPEKPSPAFQDSVVKQIKDGEITFFRPYVHTADFSFTGGVICYIGIEEWNSPTNHNEVELLESVTLK